MLGAPVIHILSLPRLSTPCTHPPPNNTQVEEWLRRIKCGECAAAFRDKDMDGTALSGLYRMGSDAGFLHQVLSQELGVRTLGQRLRLVEELHRLFS